jgi:hypothetical protein
MLFAQLADALDKEAWNIIFCAGFGAPIGAGILRIVFLRKPFQRRLRTLVASYYVIAAALFIAIALHESALTAIPFYLLLVFGPVVGLFVAFL